MPPNRIVALLTPVIAIAAGAAATWLADNVGIEIDQGELQAIFVAGLLAVLAPAAQWLNGFQKYERHQQDLDHAALEADAEAAARTSAVPEPDAGDDAYDEDGGYDDDGYAEDFDEDDEEFDDEPEPARADADEPATVGA
jgi:hypothetical protein